ncbi:hypothetical protein E8E14_000278 [Neopestalotiopsis sp. 37M]|nr:hypothetical protein E8E14_000278 [Neopestalotiopsis sp. 37M]
MDVPYRNPAFDEYDLDEVFEYEERQSRVVWRSDDKEEFIVQELEKENEWSQWAEAVRMNSRFPATERFGSRNQMIGILVELERERHYDLVKTEVTGLLQLVYEISKSKNNKVSESPEVHRQSISIDSWAKVSHLRTGLESWKTQLIKMIAHIDELEYQLKRIPSVQTTNQEKDDIYEEFDSKEAVDTSEWHSGCVETGRRIKNRLMDILCEYEENIRECTMVIDGVTLASQMSWNQIGYQDAQANLRIASDTRHDSGQMRSIAVLTMIFLPATFVSHKWVHENIISVSYCEMFKTLIT